MPCSVVGTPDPFYTRASGSAIWAIRSNTLQNSGGTPPEFQTSVFPSCTRMRACLHNSLSAPPHACCKPSGLVEMCTSSRNAINRSPSASPSSIAHKLACCPRAQKGHQWVPLFAPFALFDLVQQCRRAPDQTACCGWSGKSWSKGTLKAMTEGSDVENARSRELASVPLSLGGLGLRSATRTREAAYWASWADCLFMVRNRHPVVVDRILDARAQSAAVAAHHLVGVEGFQVPSWEALSHGLRPRPHGQSMKWRCSGRRVDHMQGWRSQLPPRVSSPALIPHCFAFSSSFRLCRCGRPLDSFGHHCAACSRAGVLGRRGFAVESAAARVCHEAGGRVTLNMMVRDMDLAVPHAHTAGNCRRRFATVWGHTTGHARHGAAHRDGVALLTVRRQKERTCPELIGPHARARLVVLAGEVDGLRRRDRDRSCASWPGPKHGLNRPSSEAGQSKLGGSSTLACSAAWAFAASLLNLRVGGGADGNVIWTHEVVHEFRHEGLM